MHAPTLADIYAAPPAAALRPAAACVMRGGNIDRATVTRILGA